MNYTPSRLYERDYTELSEAELQEKGKYLSLRKDILKATPYSSLSVPVRHNLSVFPNNLIVLSDMKASQDLKELNRQFDSLIHKDGAKEREVLDFINKTPAYHIVGSILQDRYPFGHHECYLFKEFRLGADYRADYLIIGKGSGGYEFVFIEFESPKGRITLKDGHWGEANRRGCLQIKDWNKWLDGHFCEMTESLKLAKGEQDLPEELTVYDSSRVHYVVVAGLREDYNGTTYNDRRERMKAEDITVLHYDNLLDNSNELSKDESPRDTF